MPTAALARVLSCSISVALLAVATPVTLLVNGVARVRLGEGVALGALRCRLADLSRAALIRRHRQVLPGATVDGDLKRTGARAIRHDVPDLFSVGEPPPGVNHFGVGELRQILSLTTTDVVDTAPFPVHVGHVFALVAEAKVFEPNACGDVASMQNVLVGSQCRPGVEFPRNSMCPTEPTVVVVEGPVTATAMQPSARPQEARTHARGVFRRRARCRPGREPLTARRLIRPSLVHATIITSGPRLDMVRR